MGRLKKYLKNYNKIYSTLSGITFEFVEKKDIPLL